MLTAEQQAAKNEQGKASGCLACPVCGDSMLWKKFHETEFFSGTITPVFAGSPFNGALGIMALCEECWPKLTPQQRLPYYEQRTATWLNDVKPVKKTAATRMQSVVTDDCKTVQRPMQVLIDDAEDALRADGERGLIDIQREAVKLAVLAGK